MSFENAALPLVVTHPDGRVAMANRAMCELLGYGFADIVNRPVWELHAEPERGERCFHKLLQTGKARENLLVLRRSDGQSVPTYSSGLVTRDDRGTVIYAIAQSLPI